MELTQQQLAIEKTALDFAKANKKQIAKKHTDPAVYCPEKYPVSVFMAGSPGAGKTEASIELVGAFEKEDCRVIRIDPDELRSEFADYDGGNSFLFQKAVSVLVERIHDLALSQKQSFLLDGTLSNLQKADQNIERSLKKDRMVQILYVYQDPRLAWEFVQARELEEGRRILPEHFIEQYFAARKNVNYLKQKYGKQLYVDLLLKEVDNSNRAYQANIDVVDNHIPEKYTPAALKQVLDC